MEVISRLDWRKYEKLNDRPAGDHKRLQSDEPILAWLVRHAADSRGTKGWNDVVQEHSTVR